jgi:hypothetical protein
MKNVREITIHPESEEQFETVKAVLEALKVPFDSESVKLPESVIKSIDKSLEQIEEGKTISFQSFKEKHFRKYQ